MSGVEIRWATGSDHDELSGLEVAIMGGEAWSRNALGEEVAGPGRVALVAVDDGVVVGWALARVVAELAELLRVGVLPEYRRRGIAATLIEAARREAFAAGAERVLLEVSETNDGALAAYASTGFVEIHRRRRYYRDGSDALVLQWSRVPESAPERAVGHTTSPPRLVDRD